MTETTKAISVFYDNWSDSQIKSGALVFKQRLNHFIRLLPGKKIIDVGCGPGHDTNYLTRQGFNCLGIDFSRTMLAYARRHFAGRFQKKNLLTLRFRRSSVDGIWSSAVLMHFSQTQQAKILKSWHRLLRPRGILGLIVPKKTRRCRRTGQLRLASYDPAKLRNQLATAGFGIVYEEEFSCLDKKWLFVLAKK